jgi:hypothetical protein
LNINASYSIAHGGKGADDVVLFSHIGRGEVSLLKKKVTGRRMVMGEDNKESLMRAGSPMSGVVPNS